MALLEEHDFGTQGWNNIATANVQKVNLHLRGPLEADENLGDSPIADSAAATSADFTGSAGTPGTNIADVGASFNQSTLNDNFASLRDQHNKLRADYLDLQTQFNALLAKLRETGGNGVLADNP